MTQDRDSNEYRPSLPCRRSRSELIANFRAIVGDKYAVTDAADIAPYVTEERDLFHGRSPLVLRPGSTRGSLRDLQARQRTPDRAGAAGRQHRPRRRPDAAQWRGRGLDAAAGQDPRHRHRVQHHDLRGRRGAADRAAARRRGRPAVSAVARRRRKLHHRRQSLHQCRRHRGAGLWRGARDGARAGGGAGRRARS